MGFILFLVANILFIPLTVLNMFVVLFKHRKVHGFLSIVNSYFRQTAVDLDKFANHNFRTLWNATLIVEGGYPFGRANETISSALGKNELKGTLSKTGATLCLVLNTLEKNHCVKSIED